MRLGWDERSRKSPELDRCAEDAGVFFFNVTATTEIYTLSLHDALPISAVRVRLAKAAESGDLRDAFHSFTALPKQLNLPSAPARPIVVRDEPDRPQPRLDRDAGGGMSISVGRIARDGVLGHRFVALSHNTIRGAAGAAILNAELLLAKGYLHPGD